MKLIPSMRVLAWVWLLIGSLVVGIVVGSLASRFVAESFVAEDWWIGIQGSALAWLIGVPALIGGWLQLHEKRPGRLLLEVASVLALVFSLICVPLFMYFAHAPEITRPFFLSYAIVAIALALVLLSLATLAHSGARTSRRA